MVLCDQGCMVAIYVTLVSLSDYMGLKAEGLMTGYADIGNS